jgi:hypothetical protein
MNKKNEVSISTTRRRRHVDLANAFFSAMALAAIALIITAKADIFVIAYGQDLNPPTTGKTSPHVTSTFGPNIPGRANGSSTIGNGTQGNVNNSIEGYANEPK